MPTFRSLPLGHDFTTDIYATIAADYFLAREVSLSIIAKAKMVTFTMPLSLLPGGERELYARMVTQIIFSFCRLPFVAKNAIRRLLYARYEMQRCCR